MTHVQNCPGPGPGHVCDCHRRPRHQQTLMRSPLGCWATCTCGWRSADYPSTASAHTEFGQHLLAVG